MEFIERPKKVTRAESSTQNNEQLQKNLQSQINNIYDKLDEIVTKLNS